MRVESQSSRTEQTETIKELSYQNEIIASTFKVGHFLHLYGAT